MQIVDSHNLPLSWVCTRDSLTDDTEADNWLLQARTLSAFIVSIAFGEKRLVGFAENNFSTQYQAMTP